MEGVVRVSVISIVGYILVADFGRAENIVNTPFLMEDMDAEPLPDAERRSIACGLKEEQIAFNRSGTIVTECKCKEGLSGPACSNASSTNHTNDFTGGEFSFCESNPCLEGRVCSPLKNSTYIGYRCTCPEGSTQEECYDGDLPFGCSELTPCLHNGSCYRTGEGYSTCYCQAGYTGDQCEIEVPTPCHSHPCQNGGSCLNIRGEFDCICEHGFTGKLCNSSVTTDLCIPNSCKNGGTCIAFLEAGFTICNCPPGYSGRKCETRNPCDPNPCKNGGRCHSGLGSNEYRCKCPNMFRGANCETKDTIPCLPNTCRNGGTCYSVSGPRNSSSVRCACAAGYRGGRCQFRDPCSPNPCMYLGICNSTFGFRSFACSCRKGFSGELCQYHECNPNPCRNGGVCRAVPGTGDHTCACARNYTGPNCELGPCSTNLCLNGGTCVENSASPPWFTCLCSVGWTGAYCDSDINRETSVCKPNPCIGGCRCQASCRHENGYVCLGSDGQLGRNCSLPAPNVTCGSTVIRVRVDSRIADEYGISRPNFEVFMSNSSSINPTEDWCPAVHTGTYFDFSLLLPFNKCGTVTSTMKDGGTSVMNTIWMNKLVAGGKAEMPIPVVQFACIYDTNYNVITSLSPRFETARRVTATGVSPASAIMEICKSGDSCPLACPPAYSLTRGAVYTVGETLHLRISPEITGITLRVWDMFLSCAADPSEAVSESPVHLLVSGCLPTNSSRYNPTEIRPARNGICASFPLPFLPGCSALYIHAKLQSCTEDCDVKYNACKGRNRRSIAHPKVTSQVAGPVIVIKGNTGISRTLYPVNRSEIDDSPVQPTVNPTRSEFADLILQITLVGLVCLIAGLFGTLLWYSTTNNRS